MKNRKKEMTPEQLAIALRGTIGLIAALGIDDFKKSRKATHNSSNHNRKWFGKPDAYKINFKACRIEGVKYEIKRKKSG